RTPVGDIEGDAARRAKQLFSQDLLVGIGKALRRPGALDRKSLRVLPDLQGSKRGHAGHDSAWERSCSILSPHSGANHFLLPATRYASMRLCVLLSTSHLVDSHCAPKVFHFG